LEIETIFLIPRCKMAQLDAGLAMSLGTRRDLIFGHDGNARAAASVILVGVLATLIGSVFMAIGPRFKQELRPAHYAYIGDSTSPVRVIGHAPRENGSCDQQVWPNIDQRCLVRTEATANSGNTPSPEQNEKLSPLTPTAPTVGRQSSSQDATLGSMPQYATTPTPLAQDSLNVTEPSDATVDSSGELRQQDPIEPPRKRARQHYRTFHLHFGAFRF
jgi:hypothetical protein